MRPRQCSENNRLPTSVRRLVSLSLKSMNHVSPLRKVHRCTFCRLEPSLRPSRYPKMKDMSDAATGGTDVPRAARLLRLVVLRNAVNWGNRLCCFFGKQVKEKLQLVSFFQVSAFRCAHQRTIQLPNEYFSGCFFSVFERLIGETQRLFVFTNCVIGCYRSEQFVVNSG